MQKSREPFQVGVRKTHPTQWVEIEGEGDGGLSRNDLCSSVDDMKQKMRWGGDREGETN